MHEVRLQRLLDILTALGDSEATSSGGLGVVRIAELVGREKSQVSRALTTLADSGLVARDPVTREYRLGWRLFTLAARVGPQQLLTLSPPLVRGLVASLGESVHLSVLDGREVVTLLSEASPSVVRAVEWSGRGVPAHCTSSGRALLLDCDRASLEALFADVELQPRGPRAVRDLDELHRRIVKARAWGYAIVDEEFEPGLVGVAAPVRDFRDRIVAALNVSAPKFRFARRLDVAGGEIKAAADELSRRLGWVDGGRGAAAGAADHRSIGGHRG